jgi:hypothetical protein
MNILKEDAELRPLIFEHELLLQALLPINELKAEQMLSVLTAAETEMYEGSRHKEEAAELNERLEKAMAEVQHLHALKHAQEG